MREKLRVSFCPHWEPGPMGTAETPAEPMGLIFSFTKRFMNLPGAPPPVPKQKATTP